MIFFLPFKDGCYAWIYIQAGFQFFFEGFGEVKWGSTEVLHFLPRLGFAATPVSPIGCDGAKTAGHHAKSPGDVAYKLRHLRCVTWGRYLSSRPSSPTQVPQFLNEA